MILAGIDEAGLGPALGPLCIAATAFRVPDEWGGESLWAALDNVVARDKKRGDSRILINDSKIVHASRKATGLERGAFAFLGNSPQVGALPECRESFLACLGSHEALHGSHRYPWYRDAEWRVPEYLDKSAIEPDVDGLRSELLRSESAVAHIAASVIPAGELNDRFDSGLNKSEVSMAEVGKLIQSIRLMFPDEDISLFVDKQGGRNSYAPFLFDLFPGDWIDSSGEGADGSYYRVVGGHAAMKICFIPKADSKAFPVALASIYAKYLRERFMDDLNRYFSKRMPGLKPTAGYHGDAPRFLANIDPVLQEEKIPRNILIRNR